MLVYPPFKTAAAAVDLALNNYNISKPYSADLQAVSTYHALDLWACPAEVSNAVQRPRAVR